MSARVLWGRPEGREVYAEWHSLVKREREMGLERSIGNGLPKGTMGWTQARV